jgi:hypothetical protein
LVQGRGGVSSGKASTSDLNKDKDNNRAENVLTFFKENGFGMLGVISMIRSGAGVTGFKAVWSLKR